MKNIAKFTRQSFVHPPQISKKFGRASQNLGGIIDHTNIEKDATTEDIKKTCQEAIKYGFRGVCVNPEWVKLAKEELKGTDIHPVKSPVKSSRAGAKQFNRGILPKAELFNGVKVVVLIDPPIGDSSHKKRVEMCKKAKKDGADDLDIVINIPAVKHEKWDEVLNDLKEVCEIGDTKVIIGSGYLTDEEIKKASQVVKEAGAICVKTSTFKDPLDHFELKEKARHLKIMRETAPGLEIKAAGNIKTLKDLELMVSAGADIIGTSSGVEIMKESSKLKA